MKVYLFVCLICLCLAVSAQKEEPLLKPGRIIFYNAENLFDTIDDPETKDEEFLPQSKSNWNTEKYKLKLKHISEAIGAMLDTIQPIVIGLSEVENRRVLEDLIEQPALKKFNLGIVHHDSPDIRGIDCALLYNRDVIDEVFDAFLPVKFSWDSTLKTRDITYFKGYMSEDFPVWIFVNHWPSRRAENVEGERMRLTAAAILKAKIENVYDGEPQARIVVMGDFNDNPDDKSITSLCTGKYDYAPNETLVDLMKPMQVKHEFTLRYRDENDVFDQFIVSKNMLGSANFYYVRNSAAHIFKPSWLLFDHPKYGLIPNRTYARGRWVGGYSDHLPVYMDICFH